ncbi:kinase-like domain-containing protein [Lasiosphaeris hirsuta]|uniref:Autophagy-related protein 1 n=1 Tax=Lasiosphaeris hirsuta TaxID=260670 RepID=A0AA40B0Z1_9PEZI|nr:kinase-like domain-containing protein [Lasiosphaeris hirsuta]
MSVKNWNNFSAASSLILELLRVAKWDATITDSVNPITTQSRRVITERWVRQPLLGHGSYGEVFREECISEAAGAAGKVRVVNVLSILQASDAGLELALQIRLSRLEYEAFYARSTGWFAAGVHLNLAMECLAGAREEGVAVSRQMLRAVELIHDLGITHNDIKLENVLIKSCPEMGGKWWIKLADWGLSRYHHHPNMNVQGVLEALGTPGDMVPELLKMVKPGETSLFRQRKKAEMWAVGVSIFKMLTGLDCFPSDITLRDYVRTRSTACLDTRLSQQGVSVTGQEFLRSLIHLNATERPDASEALADPWIVGTVDAQLRYRHTTRLTNEHVCSLSLSRNSDRLLIVTPTRLHSVSTSNPKDSITHEPEILVATPQILTTAAISPDDQFVTAVGTCGMLLRFEFPGLNLVETQPVGPGKANTAKRTVAYSHDGRHLATTCKNQLAVVDLENSAFNNLTRVSGAAMGASIQTAQFHEDNQQILVGGAVGLSTFSLAGPKLQLASFAPYPVAKANISISPNGVRAVAIGMGAIYIREPDWDCWRRQYSCEKETGPAVFSSDGSTFAISDEYDQGGVLIHGSAGLNDVWDTWFKEADFSCDAPMKIALSASLVVTAYESTYEPGTTVISIRTITREACRGSF